VAELLVQGQASVHARNRVGVAPLHVASQGGHTECVRTLLIAGAQADVRSQQNNSPLSLAQANRRSDVIELLLNPPPVDANLAQAVPVVPPVSVEGGEPPAQGPVEVATALIILEKTRALVRLGFAPEHASAALAACGGDSARAAQALRTEGARGGGEVVSVSGLEPEPEQCQRAGESSGDSGGAVIDEID
jgi:ankyrin repeat protein